MTNQDIDAVMSACGAWVKQHHRTALTVQEAGAIRVKLKDRLHSKWQAKPDIVELVQLAHHHANNAVTARRDRTQRAEHGRMVRA